MVVVKETVAAAQTTGLIAGLTARLQPLNVHVEHVVDSAAAASFLTNVRAELTLPDLVVSSELATAAPSLMAMLKEADVTWRQPIDVAASRDVPFGVSLATLAIAETGSVMLAEETLEDRAVGMLTKTNVVVVRAETIVPTLVEAAVALRAQALRPGGGHAALVTGPSRTADIELSLSLGVQGPERVYVLVVDDLT